MEANEEAEDLIRAGTGVIVESKTDGRMRPCVGVAYVEGVMVGRTACCASWHSASRLAHGLLRKALEARKAVTL